MDIRIALMDFALETTQSMAGVGQNPATCLYMGLRVALVWMLEHPELAHAVALEIREGKSPPAADVIDALSAHILASRGDMGGAL